MDPEARKLVRQTGIPTDSVHNELSDWVILSRISNPRLRVAIKGDRDSNYPIIKQVINTLIDNRVTRFNFITNLEKEG
jgi:biopolymer transport protein ExbD